MMFGVGLIICAVMFVGMLATGGPHRMMNAPERFNNSARIDDRGEQISEGHKPMTHSGHAHVETDAAGGADR